MKAILIVDIPNDFEFKKSYADITLFDGKNRMSIRDEVEVKPMPQKVETPKIIKEQIDGWHKLAGEYIGWNACIDEILGEQE